MKRRTSASFSTLNHSANPYLIAACERKTGYDNEWAARRTGRAVIRGEMGAQKEPADKLWVYPCAHCRRFHLTKVESPGVAITAHEMYEGTGM